MLRKTETKQIMPALQLRLLYSWSPKPSVEVEGEEGTKVISKRPDSDFMPFWEDSGSRELAGFGLTGAEEAKRGLGALHCQEEQGRYYKEKHKDFPAGIVTFILLIHMDTAWTAEGISFHEMSQSSFARRVADRDHQKTWKYTPKGKIVTTSRQSKDSATRRGYEVAPEGWSTPLHS